MGVVPSGKAADVLRLEAGCPTDTLAGFLTRHRDRYESPWPIGTTVIVDQAGMAKTQDLAKLIGLARRHHWRIVAVGDPAQLPSVGRGGLFGPVVELADGTRALPGDQIATRHNDPTLQTTRGDQVRNRQVWTIDRVHEHGQLTVRAPDRGTVVLPADYAARHVELGWAVTGYGNQGDTVDIGFAIIEPGTTRNHTYVALTRCRQANHALIPAPTGTLDAAEHLTQTIDRATDREAAIPTLKRLRHQAGLEPPDIDHVLGIELSFDRER